MKNIRYEKLKQAHMIIMLLGNVAYVQKIFMWRFVDYILPNIMWLFHQE